MVSPTTSSNPRGDLYAQWARLIDTILPEPDENRLVPVAEVGRSALSQVEGNLADVGVAPILSETRTANGESRFQVLVPTRDAAAARRAVAGL